MGKIKKSFFCQNCGAQHVKWQGQCGTCKEWNSLSEEIISTEPTQNWNNISQKNNLAQKALKINEIKEINETIIDSFDKELNRVLGGGIVSGSLILLSGEPGVGKSTLLLQIALKMDLKVLYVSGEESQKQIKLRAERIRSFSKKCFILNETLTENIFDQIKKIDPSVVVIDSIQTLKSVNIENSPGSVSQIRGCTEQFIKFSKETNKPVFLVGHITKDGQIAGPKILEHMVDVVLHFEGDKNNIYRILRAQKNRFGSTSEIGIYLMGSNGLSPVSNPSELLIQFKKDSLSGHAIACILEGSRPLLIEVQALVSSAVYGTPQRTSNGFNSRRLNMLLAVLEKRAGFALASKDVFINVAGGISVEDPSIDLAVIASILSSYYDKSISQINCFSAEIGLSGEIRPVSKIEQRIKECSKLGYKNFVTSKSSKIQKLNSSIKVIAVSKIEQLIKYLFS